MVDELRYLGHSAFYIRTGEYGILIDPFISQNPNAKFDLRKDKVTHILLTHAHGDHMGDAIPIARQTGAVIVAVFELGNYCASQGANAIPAGLGGEIKLEWGSVWLLPAFHTSSLADGSYAGVAVSILIEINGVKLYHAGDTALNSEMKLIGEIYHPEYSMLPIGGHFTMGIKEAALAAKFLDSRFVIPMHYNTFDVIKADPKEFESLIIKQNQTCCILNSGESIEIK